MSIKILFGSCIFTLIATICMAKEFGSDRAIAQEIISLIKHDEDVNVRRKIHNEVFKKYLYQIDTATAFAEQGIKDSWVRSFFYKDGFGPTIAELVKGLVYLSEQKAPKLYALVKEVAKAAHVPMPPVFLAGDKEFFNALASSLSPSVSMIVLGQKLVEEMTDEELRGVIAHELGHVAYNHIPKTIITNLLLFSASIALSLWITNKICSQPQYYYRGAISSDERWSYFMITNTLLTIATFLISVYLTYRHECQADDAAIATVGAQPFLSSMEAIKKYIMGELEIFDKEHAYCLEQLKTLEKFEPEEAKSIKENLEKLKTETHEKIEKSLDQDWDHPALNKRIEYGREQLNLQK